MSARRAELVRVAQPERARGIGIEHSTVHRRGLDFHRGFLKRGNRRSGLSAAGRPHTDEISQDLGPMDVSLLVYFAQVMILIETRPIA
ncbi:hypothetical protein MEA186_00786 [Mesorhizobium amorphae CCNWGS0123]|uniref:Uncharacterized protein n=1 Tax=Mesorhizobium amorphae CCNWGS0123 TaxID=1082933 RepID=G6Y2L6_9HYPH|nr:hypothetical protein A6B35_31925 [Mesorhizobium amorphae CCNWGS0123]EHH13977.1 hypothetical protein MEA186_00786 [Mesorhizobium amorphae CCNWGS0123]